MRQQDVAELVGAFALVVILGGLVSVFANTYGWPLYLQWAIAGPPSGWILQTVGRRVTDRRRTYRD